MFEFFFAVFIICFYWLSTARSSKLPRKSIDMLRTCPNNPCLITHEIHIEWAGCFQAKEMGGSAVMSCQSITWVTTAYLQELGERFLSPKMKHSGFFPQGMYDFFTMWWVKIIVFYTYLDKAIKNWFRNESLCPILNINYMKNLVS